MVSFAELDFTQLPVSLPTLIVIWEVVKSSFIVYLDSRQYSRAKASKLVPEHLKDYVDDKTHKLSAAYEVDQRSFSQVRTIYSTIEFIFDVFVVLPFSWRLAGELVDIENEFLHAITFMLLGAPISLVAGLIFDYYHTFVLEEKHGFNKTTLATFVTDRLKGYVLMALFGCPILFGTIKIIRWAGDSMIFYTWLFTTCVMFFMMAIAPTVIMPWFNKYEPLKNEVLKEKIQKLADSLSFPLYGLYEVDGSKRSSHSNAFFYGFWRFKRIVLFDTLLDIEHDDILAILCHELGHWKYGHTFFNMGLALSQTFLQLTLFSIVSTNPTISIAMGVTDNTSDVVLTFCLLGYLLSPLGVVIERLMIIVTRIFEYQADEFAYKMGYGNELISALNYIHKENKKFADADPMYSWWYFSHPSFYERKFAIEALLEKDNITKKITESK